MKDRKLILEPQFDGIYVREEGDEKYGAYISNDRKIRIEPSKTFSEENLQKIQDLAYSSNMIITDGKFRNRFALSIINMKPTKEHVDNIKDEVNQLYIETVDGKEYVCTRNGEIFPGKPEDYNDIPIIANPEGKKYILTDYTCQVDGQTLYRIRAVKSFPGVKAGELGGYVAGEHNLSQDGICWIFPKAVVRENASVKDEARVFGKSRLEGNALLKEYARTYDYSHISGNARIGGSAQASGYSRISGFVQMLGESRAEEYAQLSGSVILTDGARVHDHAKLSGNVQIKGNAKLTEFVCICENSRIEGDVVLSGDTIVKGNTHISTQEQANKVIKPCISKTSSNEIIL